MACCDVTFKTTLRNYQDLFGSKGIRHTVDQDSKWSDILAAFELDPKIHYLRSSDGKCNVCLHDKVEDYTKQFKKHRSHYVIHVHKMDKARQQEFAQQQQQANLERTHKGQRHVVTSPSPPKLTKQQVQRNKRPKKQSKQVGRTNGIQYEEDGFQMPPEYAPTAPQFFRFPAEANDEYAVEDDIMSQDSQDSQDIEPGMKSLIVDKIVKRVGNGDMTRIKNELLKLKTGNKLIKASRLLPFTLTILQDVFLG